MFTESVKSRFGNSWLKDAICSDLLRMREGRSLLQVLFCNFDNNNVGGALHTIYNYNQQYLQYINVYKNIIIYSISLQLVED